MMKMSVVAGFVVRFFRAHIERFFLEWRQRTAAGSI
jgi:hypothetical protein